MKNVKKEQNNMKGITLIALAITIIIILILAGISITTLSGDNGIIGKAAEAKISSEKSEEKEIIETSAIQAMGKNKYGNINEEDLRTIINQSTTADVTADGSVFIVKISDRRYLVDENGDVSEITWWKEKQENGDIIITNGDTRLKVGDYINYDANSNGEVTYTSKAEKTGITDDQTFSTTFNTDGWRLLDIDYSGEGGEHLVIIPNKFIKSTANTTYSLKEPQASGTPNTAYQYAVDEIKNICKIYGNGKKASYARSMEIEDLNKITGYNPLKTGNGQPYGKDKIEEYSTTVSVTGQSWRGPYQAVCSNGTTYTETYPSFNYWDEKAKMFKRLEQGEEAIIKNTGYWYYPTTLTTSSTGDIKGLKTSSTLYKMLFNGTKAFMASRSSSYYYYGIFTIIPDLSVGCRQDWYLKNHTRKCAYTKLQFVANDVFR